MKKTEQQKSFKGFRWTIQDTEPILTRLVKASKEGFLKAGEVKKIISAHLGRECPFSPRVADAFSRDFPNVVIEEQGRCAGKKYRFICPELKDGDSKEEEGKIESKPKSESGKVGYKRNFLGEERPELLYAILCLITGNGMDMDISSLVRGLQLNTCYPFNVRKTVIERLSKDSNFTLTSNGQNVRFQSVDGVWMPEQVTELWHVPQSTTVMKLAENREISISPAVEVGLPDVYRITYLDLISIRDSLIDAIIITGGMPMAPGGTQPLVTGCRRDLWEHLFRVSLQRIGWWRDPFAHLPSRTNMTQEKANFLFRKGEKKLHELLMKE